MAEPITHCSVCGTHWADADVFAEATCAACLRMERDECRRLLRSVSGAVSGDSAEWKRWLEDAAKAVRA